MTASDLIPKIPHTAFVLLTIPWGPLESTIEPILCTLYVPPRARTSAMIFYPHLSSSKAQAGATSSAKWISSSCDGGRDIHAFLAATRPSRHGSAIGAFLKSLYELVITLPQSFCMFRIQANLMHFDPCAMK